MERPEEKIYRAGSTCLKQVQFPSRATAIRSSGPRSRPPANYMQCTLTQLDGVDLRDQPRRTAMQREESLISRTFKRQSSDTSADGKKRRRNQLPALSDSQRTLTQLLSSSFSAEDLELEPFVDKENEDAKATLKAGVTRTFGRRQFSEVIPETQWQFRTEESLSDLVEQAIHANNPKPACNDDVVENEPAVDKVTILSTPIKERRLEIPSSNTPPSTLTRSNRSRRYAYDPVETPSKRHRLMISSPPAVVDHILNVPNSPVAISRHDDLDTVFARPELPKVRRRIIPDSQVTQALLPHPSLVQRSTIPDSQADEEELFQDLVVDPQPVEAYTHSRQDNGLLQSSVAGLTQYGYTVDPACSALDRDAERFFEMASIQDCIPATHLQIVPASSPELHQTVDRTFRIGCERASVPDHEIDMATARATIDLTSDPPNTLAHQPTTPTASALSQHDPALPKSQRLPRPSQASTVVDSPTSSPTNVRREIRGSSSPDRRLQQHDFTTSRHTFQSSSPLPMPPRSLGGTPQTGRSARSRRYSLSMYTSDLDLAPHTTSPMDHHLDHDETDNEIHHGNIDLLRVFDEGLAEQNNQLKNVTAGMIAGRKRNLDMARLDPRKSVKKRRRIRRAQELLPDSLLDFSIPAAPPWSSPNLRPGDKGVDDDDEGGEGDLDLPALPDDGVHGNEMDGSGANVGRVLCVDPDYSLPAPSSDWRSSGTGVQ